MAFLLYRACGFTKGEISKCKAEKLSMKNAKNGVKIINIEISYFSYCLFCAVLMIRACNTGKYKMIYKCKCCLYVNIKMLMVAKFEARRNFLAK